METMDDIDEQTVPPVNGMGCEFRPLYPEKPPDEGLLITKLGLKKKVVRGGEGWEVPDEGDEITGDHPVLLSSKLFVFDI